MYQYQHQHAPFFLAVICGCNAGLFREALHEVYIPRIQRGNASFTANVLGARSALLSVLIHFFEDERSNSCVRAESLRRGAYMLSIRIRWLRTWRSSRFGSLHLPRFTPLRFWIIRFARVILNGWTLTSRQPANSEARPRTPSNFQWLDTH